MTSVLTTSTIAGPIEAVFDLVTSARFWRQWHPATLAVAGVTERPYQRGEVVHEHARIGPMEFKVAWDVVEHERPRRVVLRNAETGTRILYGFEPGPDGVNFRREVVYNEALLAPDHAEAFRTLMDQQSAQGVARLKELVERILLLESEGLA